MARDREEFSDSEKRAKLLIENQYERKLDRAKPAGAIFALKNMGWSDRQEVELRGAFANLDVTQLPDELVGRLARGEHPLSVLAGAQALPPASNGEAGKDGATYSQRLLVYGKSNAKIARANHSLVTESRRLCSGFPRFPYPCGNIEENNH